MRILLLGYGSRGDVQPLLALGEGLQTADYEITIAAASNFQSWIEGEGFAYASFGSNVQDVMNSATGKEWVENSSTPLREAQNMKRLVEEYESELGDDLRRICQDADVLVSGLVTFGMAESIAEKLGKRHISALLQPLTPSKLGASTLVPTLPQRSLFVNRWSGYIGLYFLWWIFKGATNRFRRKLGLSPFTYGEFVGRWNHMPLIYGISPLVTPRDPDWHDQICVTGYWFWQQSADWQPSEELCDFLEAGRPPVYIGFGSMSNKNPEATTTLMLDAIKRSGQRGIIYSGWAGLEADDLPEDIFLLDGAPHDWLFPRMAALVHHGGAGTTAAGLRAGVPATVVSHMADQPYWGRRVHELGVGEPPIRRHQLNAERLAAAIVNMTSDEAMQAHAAELGARIRQEDGVSKAVEAIATILQR